MLLRLAYLGVTNVFARLLRLLPMSSRDKDAEILALRHRIPGGVLKRLHLVVRPDTVLRWHRDMFARRHARRSRSQPRRLGRPRTVRSIRGLVVRLVRENPGWGYLRVHGELLVPRCAPPSRSRGLQGSGR